MHSVRCKQNDVSAAALQLECGFSHQGAYAVPFARALKRFDLGEIDSHHRTAGVVMSAQLRFGIAVQQPIVLG